MEVVLGEKVPVFSFTFGVPDDKWLEAIKQSGTLIVGTATNVEEAEQLESRGVDAVCAQSSEAGGHRGTFIGEFKESLLGLSTLVPQIADKVQLPVIASGGIMDACGIAAALKLGAAAVQMGTAFLSCAEAGIHAKYKQTLLDTTKDETILTRAFSGKWARGIKNRFIDEMSEYEKLILPYPIQNVLTRALRKEAAVQNRTDFMSMWAGQGVALSKGLPVADLMAELIKVE